jgi:hypothetical protein
VTRSAGSKRTIGALSGETFSTAGRMITYCGSSNRVYEPSITALRPFVINFTPQTDAELVLDPTNRVSEM